MAVAIANRTLGETVSSVSQRCGYLLNQGTATAGATTSLTDATNERTPLASIDEIKGSYIYITAGTAAGESHELTTYGTIGVMGWQTAGTAPTTSSKWIRLRRRPQEILDSISRVTRDAAHAHARPYTFEGIMTNNLLGYPGGMEEWASGTSSAPTGWTLSGSGAAVARDPGTNTTFAAGRHAAALTPGSSAVAILTCRIPEPYIRRLNQRYKTTAVTMRGYIAENAAGNAVMRLTQRTVDGGTITNTNYDRTGTQESGNYESIYDDISKDQISLEEKMVRLTVELRGAANASVMSFDDIWVGGPDLYEYELPPTMIGMRPTIWMEDDSASGNWSRALHFGQNWTLTESNSAIDTDSTTGRTIVMQQSLPSHRHLRIDGFRAPDVITAATSNVEVDPEWLVNAASIDLLESDVPTEENQRRLQSAYRALDRMPRWRRERVHGQGIIFFERR